LVDLTRGPEKKQTFRWGEDQEHAFQALTEKVCEAPVLAMPDVQKPFEIDTDASAHALGQDGRVVAYHSETFNKAVSHYPTYELEMYTIVQAKTGGTIGKLGKETIVHSELKYLQTQSKLPEARHRK
jgi:hypothetical protein